MTDRKRTPNGKYAATLASDSLKLETDTSDLTVKVPSGWFNRILIFMFIFMIISPWLFLMLKNNGLLVLQDKITDFYATNFACGASGLVNTTGGLGFGVGAGTSTGGTAKF